MRVVLGLLAGLALWLAAASDARAERRVALVIGNSAYQNASQLPNPVNDATAIAGLLRGADFDVVELQSNLGVSDLRRAVRNFSQTAQNADIAVVYFAGHGIEVDGANYLVPVDAKLERDIDVDDESLSLERILKVIEPARRLRLVILDACRDNPFARTMKRTVASRAIGRGLARVEPDTANTLIAFAARAGSTASDGTDGNSPFTSALLKHLTKAGLDLRIAFGLIHDEVMNSTGNKQEPFVYGSLGGAFVSLVPEAPKAEPPAEPGQRLTPNADVRADYEIAERVGTVDAWAYFLAVHPSGYYANLAREQLAKLGGGARPRPQPAAAPIPDAPRPTIALAPPAGPIQPAPKPNIASVLGPAELASLLQTDLKRVGCDPGPSNGQWNGRSRRALENFNKNAGTALELAVRNFGVHGDASGVINADKTLSVDLQIKHILAATIRFDGRLGRTISGPGGTTGQANIVGRNRLRLSWNLPNNQLVVNIAISGQSCTARLDAPLKPGFREYSLYDDGSFYSYCSRLRVTSTSCRVS